MANDKDKNKDKDKKEKVVEVKYFVDDKEFTTQAAAEKYINDLKAQQEALDALNESEPLLSEAIIESISALSKMMQKYESIFGNFKAVSTNFKIEAENVKKN